MVRAMDDDRHHEHLITAILHRLGWDASAGILTGRLLAGGLSGSSIQYLDIAGQAMVLKTTPSGADQQLIQRACREALFYRDLATRVPVRVPRVLGLALDDVEGPALLLVAYSPSLEPSDWTERDYVQVARQLGQLHAAFWNKTATAPLPVWLHVKSRVTVTQCRNAVALWGRLSQRDDLHQVLTPYQQILENLLTSIPALDPQLSTMPPTLCHGDCHTGNLLQGPAGEWIWADWQEVRLGPGVDDLAFFWQRAFAAASARPPFDAILQAYSAGLHAEGGVGVSREQLGRELDWAELRSWAVDWPGYLSALPKDRIGCVLRRIEMLIHRLALSGHLCLDS